MDMITQIEADALIAMRKNFVDSVTVSLPAGSDQSHELIGEDKREKFLLDLWRGTIRLSKLKFQNRGKKVIVLVRLDIKGSPHTNPDGTKIEGTHFHVYREGFDDKWAYPIDSSAFANPNSIQQSFEDFCRYCNIETPSFQDILL
jgi:hypothetical protein